VRLERDAVRMPPEDCRKAGRRFIAVLLFVRIHEPPAYEQETVRSLPRMSRTYMSRCLERGDAAHSEWARRSTT